jgi:hypothetical protein
MADSDRSATLVSLSYSVALVHASKFADFAAGFGNINLGDYRSRRALYLPGTTSVNPR